MNKGVRARNKEIARLALDERQRGMTWGQLALKYGKEKSSIRKMVVAYAKSQDITLREHEPAAAVQEPERGTGAQQT